MHVNVLHKWKQTKKTWKWQDMWCVLDWLKSPVLKPEFGMVIILSAIEVAQTVLIFIQNKNHLQGWILDGISYPYIILAYHNIPV